MKNNRDASGNLHVTYQKTITFGILAASLFLGSVGPETLKDNWSSACPQMGVYSCNDFIDFVGSLFMTISFTSAFFFGVSRDIFKWWIALTILLLSISLPALKIMKYSHLRIDWDLFFIPLFSLYFCVSLMLFIRDLMKYHKTAKTKEHDKVKTPFRVLIIGMILIFLSGLIDPSFWFFGIMFGGIPLLFYSGGMFLYHYHELGQKKNSMMFALAVLILCIALMFIAFSGMNIGTI